MLSPADRRQMKRRKLSELNVIDDFMMNALATNEELREPFFRRILSVLLDIDIGKIDVRAQSILQGLDTDLRGVRLDVEITEKVAEDNQTRLSDPKDILQDGDETSDGQIANIYDIEPHLRKNLDFPKHNRYYQAKIDSRYVKSGLDDFEKLHNLYVITITNFDIFGEGLFEYTVRNQLIECPDVEYNDGLIFKYFNTKGKAGGNESIKNMLRFIENSTSENAVDEATREISEYVDKVKRSSETEETYMTMGDKMDYIKQEGIQEGIVIGEQHTISNIKEAAIEAGILEEFEKIMLEYNKMNQ